MYFLNLFVCQKEKQAADTNRTATILTSKLTRAHTDNNGDENEKNTHNLIGSGLLSLTSFGDVQLYQNTFSTPDAHQAFNLQGEEFITYTPPPLHNVSIDSGQLRIDTSLQMPNGPRNPPYLFGRALLTQDSTVAFGSGYKPTLSENDNLIKWSFNVSNQNGSHNSFFRVLLASTMEDAYDIGAHGYYFAGGGFVGDRMMIKRFDYGMGGGGDIIIDVTAGLAPLPEKGSFNITYNPANDEWSLYGETGSTYTDPTQVSTLLGTAIDGKYTDVDTRYFGLEGKTTGSVFYDNLTVEAIPEPLTAAFFLSAMALFVIRRNLSTSSKYGMGRLYLHLNKIMAQLHLRPAARLSASERWD